MKRASFLAAVILCAVALLCWIFPWLLLPLLVAGGFFGVVFLVLFLKYKDTLLRDLLYASVCLMVSVLVLWFPITDYYNTAEIYDGRTCSVTATLTEDPVLCSGGVYRYTVRFTDSFFSKKFVFFSSVRYTDAGGKITADFAFSVPSDTYSFQNLSEGIILNAKIVNSDSVTFSEPGLSFYRLSGKLQRYVQRTFLQYMGTEDGGFLTAVLTGNKDALSEDTYQSLSETGMLHIVAVSGLHVSIFVSFILLFLRKVPNIRLRLVLSLLSLFIIFLFAGFTPSVCRAVIMNGVLFLHQGLAMGSDSFNRLGIAAIIILLLSPYAVLSLSFQLSFAAALGILLFASSFRQEMIQWLFVRCHIICGEVLTFAISLFSVSLASFVFSLPLLWLWLDRYSVWSLFLSIPILPVLEVCMYGAFFLLLLARIPFTGLLCRFLGIILQYGVTFMTNLSFSAADLMGSAENLSPYLKWVILGVLSILAVILFFFPAAKNSSKRKKRRALRRVLGIVLFAVVLLFGYQAADQFGMHIPEGSVTPAKGVLQTAFLDVGQGNCFVSVLDDQAYIVDCGGTKQPGKTASDYLTSVGVDTVQFVLISHLHDDHANGLEDLCEEKEILEIIIPYTEGDASLLAKITELSAEEGAVLTVLETDSERTLGQSTLRMLTKHLDPTSEDQNENSIVGFCEYGNYRVMFTGDITAAAEKRLVTAYGPNLRCDVLSVPHHGSKGSSCSEFLNATSPVYAVVSVGLKNSYGHPTEEAMGRISDAGAELLRTDERSTVLIRSDGEKMEVVSSDES